MAEYSLEVDALKKNLRILLIDTCGETAGVAVCDGRRVTASEDLSRGGASAEIVGAVRRVLAAAGCKLAELDAVGVVSGPGSFTGMRTGLAAAKGLCEAAGVRLVGVSRLEVLTDAAAVVGGFVALNAGRGAVYARAVGSGREWVCRDEELVGILGETQIFGGDDKKKGNSDENSRSIWDDNQKGKCNGGDEGKGEGLIAVVVAEELLTERLGVEGVGVWPLRVVNALGVVLRRMAEDVVDAGLVEANYVLGEGDIYRKSGVPAKAGVVGS